MSDDLIILIESDETVIAEIAEQGPTGPEGPPGPPGEVEEHTHDAEDVTQDETHRFVTDAEKAAWSAKQDALGYTPVNTMDARLSDARAPTAHAASHATGGTDAITPAGIGASEAGHDHDETYAPLAKGVTNGDSHDHSGGDGGQIAFSSLGNTPTTLAGYGITDAAAAADLSGKADLVNGLVPASQLPSYVDDVLEYANLAAFPAEGETGKIYVALDDNLTYRWTGTVYGVLNPSLALGETMETAYRGDRGKTAYDHSQTAHDYAPSSHVGAGGTAHAAATDSVAGFMSAAAMAKLNGIEAGATADMTAAEILAAVKTVDGPDSGLDADTVDGFHASQTPGANQIPVLTAAGILQIGTAATMSGFQIGPLTAADADSAYYLLRGGGSGIPTRGAYAAAYGVNHATNAGNLLLCAGANGVIRFNTSTGFTRMQILSSGRILAGQTLPTDNETDAFQLGGSIITTGYKLFALNTAPASASATGIQGETRFCADAIYVCTATNTWKKVAIATW